MQHASVAPVCGLSRRSVRAGGGGAREAAAKAVVAAGIAVMGHCGLLPQSISVLGGFRPQGQSAAEALRVVQEARVRSGQTGSVLGWGQARVPLPPAPTCARWRAGGEAHQ